MSAMPANDPLTPRSPLEPAISYLTVEQLAVYVGLSRSAVYAAMRRGQLPQACYRRGNRLLWEKAKVDEYLNRAPQRRVLGGANVRTL